MKRTPLLLALLWMPLAGLGIEYPHPPGDPQKYGWPLTAEQIIYITEKPEHERRPGRESNRHLPHLWPLVPTAGHFGGDHWLKLHSAHVEAVRKMAGPIDVLLVGDSITIQWGDAWKKHFPSLKTANIGIGGDKTQNVLWRLDHGGCDGLQPAHVVLMIGNNNMFFTPETGVQAVAEGIIMCAKHLRKQLPKAHLILTTILPAHHPGHRFYQDIKRTNKHLETLQSSDLGQSDFLDLTTDFTNADGALQTELYQPDQIHLSPRGYEQYAKRLAPLLKVDRSPHMPLPTLPD